MIINNFPGGYNTLPDVSASDNGKILSVTNGDWSASSVTGADIPISTTDSTKVNSAINSLNNNVAIQTISSSVSIVSLCADIPTGEHRYYKVSLSSTITDFPLSSTHYYSLIHIYKNTDTRANINIDCITGSNEPLFITGYYENGSLYWNNINNKTNCNTRYLNDTSKTALQLLTADFANLSEREINFYSIRPSDTNLYGTFIKVNSTNGSGVLTSITGKTFQISNINGTWSEEELALNTNIGKTDAFQMEVAENFQSLISIHGNNSKIYPGKLAVIDLDLLTSDSLSSGEKNIITLSNRCYLACGNVVLTQDSSTVGSCLISDTRLYINLSTTVAASKHLIVSVTCILR